MIRDNESLVYDILVKNSNDGNWKFYECFGDDGKTIHQSKMYPGEDFWVAYPDFEYYNQNKLLLLVEAKCYEGYFGNKKYVVAMRKRHFKGYLHVQKMEKVEVRVCFALLFDGKPDYYWETISKMDRMHSKTIQKYTQHERNMQTGEWEYVTEDYVFWHTTDFRTDEYNLPIV